MRTNSTPTTEDHSQGGRACSVTYYPNGREQTRMYLLCRQVALKERPATQPQSPAPKEITNQVPHSSIEEEWRKTRNVTQMEVPPMKTLIVSLTSPWIFFLLRPLGYQRYGSTSEEKKISPPEQPCPHFPIPTTVLRVLSQDHRSRRGRF